jgi:hypothetical protein
MAKFLITDPRWANDDCCCGNRAIERDELPTHAISPMQSCLTFAEAMKQMDEMRERHFASTAIPACMLNGSSNFSSAKLAGIAMHDAKKGEPLQVRVF